MNITNNIVPTSTKWYKQKILFEHCHTVVKSKSIMAHLYDQDADEPHRVAPHFSAQYMMEFLISECLSNHNLC